MLPAKMGRPCGMLHGTNEMAAALSQDPHFIKKWQVQEALLTINIPFNKVSVFNCIKFASHDPFDQNPLAETTVDSIHVEPLKHDKYGKTIPTLRSCMAITQVKLGSKPKGVNFRPSTNPQSEWIDPS